MALVKTPNNITGIGITRGTRPTRTPTTSSSAKMLPKSRKLNDNGFDMSSKILIGSKKIAGST